MTPAEASRDGDQQRQEDKGDENDKTDFDFLIAQDGGPPSR